ncbi:MAG: 50S ribosomal protein L11 [Berkelbacteria bacterium GW2011_GWA2_38_9]|uniref:Large ribosomal subunit protein uL11 n=1 Tax=Berkelbacteria bacterium GW2011_GWA2_38_9 TaxID=1618334 RepID=A0A0G0NUZ5_9BACT|nr:MAG: 50S ribosomal protein L11 [Berkelbacteria bacterium GW2011_GWA2_38_9]
MATKKKKKPISKKIKLEITGGQANPAPPIGPILGQTGINIMEFCKAFNDQTKDQMGTIIPVMITIYEDRSYDFELRTPPAAVLIKKMIKIEKGAKNSKKDEVGVLTNAQLEEIAKMKMVDLNAFNLESAKKVIAGSARSMGVKIKN